MRVGGTLYAKQGGALTLTVLTSNDTKVRRRPAGRFRRHAHVGHGEVDLDVHHHGPDRQRRAGGHRDCVTELQRQQLHRADRDRTGVLHPRQHRAGRHGCARRRRRTPPAGTTANVSVTWSATDAGSGRGQRPDAGDGLADRATTAGVDEDGDRHRPARQHRQRLGDGQARQDRARRSAATRARPPTANGWNNTDVTVALHLPDALSGIKSCTGAGSTVSSTTARTSR